MATALCNQTVLTVDNFCAGRSSDTFDIENLESQGSNTTSPFIENYIYYTGDVTVVLCCIPDENSITYDTNLTGDVVINITTVPSPPYEVDTEITITISIAASRPFQLSDAGPIYFNVIISCDNTVYEYPIDLVDSVGCDSEQRLRPSDPAGKTTTFDLLSPTSTDVIVAYTMYDSDDTITVHDGLTILDPTITTEFVKSEGYLIFDCNRYTTIYSGVTNHGYKLFCSDTGVPCGGTLTLQDEELAFLSPNAGAFHYFDAFIFDSIPGQPFRLDYVANLVDTTVISGLFTGVGYKISLLSISPTNRNIFSINPGFLDGLDACPVTTDYNSSYDLSVGAFSGVCIGRTGLDTGYLEVTATSDKVILFISGNRLCNRDVATGVNVTVAPDVIGSSIVFTSDCNASCPP